jgi:hypothetical protein
MVYVIESIGIFGEHQKHRGEPNGLVNSPPLSDVVDVKQFPFPWFIAGGWALDLAIGKQTRLHQDVDVCADKCNLSSLSL